MAMGWLGRVASLLFLLLAMPLAASYAVEESPPLADPGIDAFDLTSRYTGSTYQIDVSLPAAYASAAPGETFPVIYVLDGQWLFPTASWVAVGGLFDRSLPPAIVVGIKWKAPHDEMLSDRFRDFTPFAMQSVPGAGHAADFRRFLSDELIPDVAKRYKAGPVRALVGLSLGGLFTIDTLVSQPDLFCIYVADSPSLTIGDGSVRRRFDNLPDDFLRKPTRLYLSWGGAESLVTNVQAFRRELDRRQFKNLRVQGGPLGHAGHAVSGTEAIAEGLLFGFSRDAISLSPAQLTKYAGHYVSADGAIAIQIKVARKGLTVDFTDSGVPNNNVPLKVIGTDHLLAEANFVELWTSRDANDRVLGTRAVIEGSGYDLVRTGAPK